MRAITNPDTSRRLKLRLILGMVLLVRDFDFAVVEQCFEFGKCGRYSPFVKAGKPVFVAEHRVKPERFCARARRLRFSAIYKRFELGRFRRTCPR